MTGPIKLASDISHFIKEVSFVLFEGIITIGVKISIVTHRSALRRIFILLRI